MSKSTRVGDIGQYCPFDQVLILFKKFIPSKEREYLTIPKTEENTYIMEQYYCINHDKETIIGIRIFRDPTTLEFLKDTEICHIKHLTVNSNWMVQGTEQEFMNAYEQVDKHFKNLLFE